MKPILILNEDVLKAIINHANNNNELECGGYLYGRVSNTGKYFKVYIDTCYYEPNRLGTEDSYNFSLLYEVNARNYGESHSKDLIGCYHSHAKYNAIFSDTDRNILEKHWNSNKVVMIYSPSYNKLVCDFVTKKKAYPMKILVMDKNYELITIDKYFKQNKISLKRGKKR